MEKNYVFCLKTYFCINYINEIILNKNVYIFLYMRMIKLTNNNKIF